MPRDLGVRAGPVQIGGAFVRFDVKLAPCSVAMKIGGKPIGPGKLRLLRIWLRRLKRRQDVAGEVVDDHVGRKKAARFHRRSEAAGNRFSASANVNRSGLFRVLVPDGPCG
jgi:hypothetical protein